MKNERGDVVGVHEKYKDSVDYMRYKDARVYRYNPLIPSYEVCADREDFLKSVSIRINKGKEYRSALGDGMFKNKSENRTEVTSEVPLPDLDDDVGCKEFIAKVWDFSKELGDLLK